MRRPEKKSETLEIRLPYSQKQAFMEACRERGVTASDVLRQFIAEDLEREAGPRHDATWTMTVRKNPLKTAAGVAGTTLAAALFGTGASFADDQVLRTYERSSDSAISYSQFGGEETGAGEEVDGPQAPLPASGPGSSLPFPPGAFGGGDGFTRRTDRTTEQDGIESRIVGLDRYVFERRDGAGTSVSIVSATKPVAVDASAQEIEAAYDLIEKDLDRMERQARPPAPSGPRGG